MLFSQKQNIWQNDNFTTHLSFLHTEKQISYVGFAQEKKSQNSILDATIFSAGLESYTYLL